MIVVTGANGQLGRAVVEALLRRLPAARIAASVRDPAGASALADRGVSVRQADFAEPDRLSTAFEGADQVLIVSVNQLGDAAHRMHRAAIDGARKAGAGRVLYTSHAGARPDSGFAPARDHAAAEAVLGEDGAPFTSLRHGFYAESALHIIGRGLETGVIRAPEDGPVNWTVRADLAEADAIVLAEAGRLNGVSPPLTAPEAFTMADVAAVSSQLSGRRFERVVVSDEEWVAAKVAEGVPAPRAQSLLGFFHAARRGDFAAADPTLEGLLGRRPRTMRDVLAAALGASTDAAI